MDAVSLESDKEVCEPGAVHRVNRASKRFIAELLAVGCGKNQASSAEFVGRRCLQESRHARFSANKGLKMRADMR